MIGLKKLAPPAQPIRYKTSANRDLVTRVFPRIAPVTCFASSSHWFIVLFTFDVFGHCSCFGFGFTNTQLKTVLYTPLGRRKANEDQNERRYYISYLLDQLIIILVD